MKPRALMHSAMRREPTERIPTMPQIYYDMPVRIYAQENGGDWIDGMKWCAENPPIIYDYLIRLVQQVGCDGLRMFIGPEPMNVVRTGDELIIVDPHLDIRIGKIDIFGGGGFIADKPAPPIQTLTDAKSRLDHMRRAFTSEKLDLLRQARQRVPDLFLASSPGGITMNTYTTLRTRELALMDLVEKPDFVCAVMDMQADTMIELAEKLVKLGIDALYIGDASASASLISPKHFERYCFPAYEKFCRHFRDSGILIYIHICGNANPLMEMLADTGVHCVEPLDPLGGVSVADTKRRIGHKVSLMGGVNTLTLQHGTPSEVKEEAIKVCREGGPSGYVLAAGDMVPSNASLANLQALVDVATKSQWREPNPS